MPFPGGSWASAGMAIAMAKLKLIVKRFFEIAFIVIPA
jgi:hypothetical protein